MEFPLEVFDVADITDALRRFSSRNRMGKIAINMEKPESLLRVQLLKHKTVFHHKKSYIIPDSLDLPARQSVFLYISGWGCV